MTINSMMDISWRSVPFTFTPSLEVVSEMPAVDAAWFATRVTSGLLPSYGELFEGGKAHYVDRAADVLSDPLRYGIFCEPGKRDSYDLARRTEAAGFISTYVVPSGVDKDTRVLIPKDVADAIKYFEVCHNYDSVERLCRSTSEVLRGAYRLANRDDDGEDDAFLLRTYIPVHFFGENFTDIDYQLKLGTLTGAAALFRLIPPPPLSDQVKWDRFVSLVRNFEGVRKGKNDKPFGMVADVSGNVRDPFENAFCHGDLSWQAGKSLMDGIAALSRRNMESGLKMIEEAIERSKEDAYGYLMLEMGCLLVMLDRDLFERSGFMPALWPMSLEKARNDYLATRWDKYYGKGIFDVAVQSLKEGKREQAFACLSLIRLGIRDWEIRNAVDQLLFRDVDLAEGYAKFHKGRTRTRLGAHADRNLEWATLAHRLRECLGVKV